MENDYSIMYQVIFSNSYRIQLITMNCAFMFVLKIFLQIVIDERFFQVILKTEELENKKKIDFAQIRKYSV